MGAIHPRVGPGGSDDPDFRRFAELIESEGYVARFEKITYRYLRVDDHVYWTSRSLWTPGKNINRRRPWADVEANPSTNRRGSPCDVNSQC